MYEQIQMHLFWSFTVSNQFKISPTAIHLHDWETRTSEQLLVWMPSGVHLSDNGDFHSWFTCPAVKDTCPKRDMFNQEQSR